MPRVDELNRKPSSRSDRFNVKDQVGCKPKSIDSDPSRVEYYNEYWNHGQRCGEEYWNVGQRYGVSNTKMADKSPQILDRGYRYDTWHTSPRYCGSGSSEGKECHGDRSYSSLFQHHYPPSLVGSETSSINSWGSGGHAAPDYERRKSHNKTIELAPGIRARLRGADETWQAVLEDRYLPNQCVCCSLTIFCIQEADYVLCPDCKTVSPMNGCFSEIGDGGVGLGFKMEDLAAWQEEIQHDGNESWRK